MTVHTRTSTSTPKHTSLHVLFAILISVAAITTPASAQDEAVSRPFVQTNGLSIRAFDVDGQVTHDFTIPSVKAYGEIYDVVRHPDGRFVALASTYSSSSVIIICTATSPQSADCSEHPIRLPRFPFRFILLGDSVFFASLSSESAPGDAILRFDLTTHTTITTPLEFGSVASGQDGLLYVYNFKSHSLSAFDPTSYVKMREVKLPAVNILHNYTSSFAIDGKGYIYLADGSFMLKLDHQGKIVNSIKFPASIFSYRNSSDGYLLANILFKDDSNPRYPFRWETVLLNSDLEIQWRKSLGRSPVGAIVEMKCVRSPITFKVVKNGEQNVANSTQYQDFTLTVRNNDSTLCGEQPVSLTLVSSTHTATLQDTTTSTLKPGEGFTTKLRVEAPAAFAGSSRFTIQARAEVSEKVHKKDVQFIFESSSQPTNDFVGGTQPKPNSSLTPPAAPQRIAVTKKGAKFRFSWSASSNGSKAKSYLVYVDGEFIKSVPAKSYTLPMNRIGKGAHTFSVRAIDERNTMSEETSVKFLKGR